eukprot:scaffold76160_cov30-Tisochrysis_lutea.AAC.13
MILQQVEVWPLAADATLPPPAAPIAQLSLHESDSFAAQLPKEADLMGWRANVAFLPANRQLLAAAGCVSRRRLLLYNYARRAVFMAVELEEWPCAIAACMAAPIIAVAGATGKVKLVVYPTAAQVEHREACLR